MDLSFPVARSIVSGTPLGIFSCNLLWRFGIIKVTNWREKRFEVRLKRVRRFATFAKKMDFYIFDFFEIRD